MADCFAHQQALTSREERVLAITLDDGFTPGSGQLQVRESGIWMTVMFYKRPLGLE